jgi:pimeloyl-ACP methyl ester carboxylesterase
MPNRSVELCRVTTSDGLLLDGALYAPAQRNPEWPVDACLLVHGTGSSFFAPGMLETFSQQAFEAGLTTLRVNTRGHDLMARIPTERGSVAGGAAYEKISDCRHDLAAWTAFLVQRGLRRIALVGHSMGGLKAIFTQSRSPLEPVTRLVAISPPRFCHAHFQKHKLAGQFREDYRRADALVSRGEGETLLQVRQPLPIAMPASQFVAKYGPHDDYDIVKLLPHVGCPTLVVIGTEAAKTSAAFDGLEGELRRMAAENARLSVRAIEGADVSYAHHAGAPFEATVEWLRGAR